MKRFAMFTLLVFVFGCENALTNPAVSDAPIAVAAFEANPESQGATFEFTEDGTPWRILFPADGYTCYIDLDRWTRTRTHKSAEQYQMRARDVPIEVTGGYGQLLGEGSGRYFGVEDDFLDSFLAEDLLIHISGEVLDGSGNRYQAVCHYERRGWANEYSFVTVDPK
jgi:hypothetical protein